MLCDVNVPICTPTAEAIAPLWMLEDLVCAGLSQSGALTSAASLDPPLNRLVDNEVPDGAAMDFSDAVLCTYAHTTYEGPSWRSNALDWH